ncbi:lipoate--protein ligase family protein [Baia soyae]|uniref:Lipoate-protein ligase A n=1 Tax=Baia soyae TaxID=1544746 RepID=A0A4R2S250_9BACL|nr:biotin/lipoate A/B protein ligase family protein [Baia soyae]TCP70608.1 lipoate-protein ligase A [Baia soyae]
MNNKWRLIPYQPHAPAWNMALDEAILTAISENQAPPTLRFYGWNPATLSIGYFQRSEKEVNLERLKELGWGFVRRMTGGRAVLHDSELTYSIIAPETHPSVRGSVSESYCYLSQGLLRGYQNLGIEAELAPPIKASKELHSAACFDAPSDYELVIHGRKAAGSAQVRQKGVVLQHGSILLDLDIDQLFEVLTFSTEEIRNARKQDLEQKAVSIHQCSSKQFDIQEVEHAFTQGFIEGLELDTEVGTLSSYEEEMAHQLVQDKYANDDWNYKR